MQTTMGATMKQRRKGVGVRVIIYFLGVLAFASWTVSACGEDKMYKEFDGIMIFYTPQDTATYRALLPEVFDLPDEPVVQAFVIDYYSMALGTLDPYQETAIFLLAKYKGEAVWYCVTMPLTSDEGRIRGIRYLGYPKVLADVTFTRETPLFRGNLKAYGKTILEVSLDTKDHPVTDAERQWFRRLAGIPLLNFLNGKLVKPRPDGSKVTTMLDLSEKYPQIFHVAAGKASWTAYPEAAPADGGWRPKAFGIGVKEIVLAYYFRNKYGFSFGKPEIVSK